MAENGMIDRGKRSVLGVGVDVIDYDGAAQRIIAAAKEGKSLMVSALAVHGVMTGALDPEHRYRLNRFDLITPDGQPVRWALRFLYGERLADRVYGPNLMLEICVRCATAGLPIYLYGSRPEVLQALAENLQRQLPALQIAGSEPSKFRQITVDEATDVDARIQASGARLVFVGLGCPRQEVFAFEHGRALSMPVIAVGAAFDFHAGLLKQAPKWMQDRGFEWLFRLGVEPRRLWRRYVYLNPAYMAMIAAQKLGLFTSRFRKEVVPAAPKGYG